jgi:hypothetical protein
MNDTQAEIKQIVSDASPEAQKLIKQVFELERSKLFMSQPIGIIDQILTTVKDVVR